MRNTGERPMTEVPLPYGAPSHVAAEVDSVFIFILVITAFFFITTQGALIYFALKYRHRKGQPDAATSVRRYEPDTRRHMDRRPEPRRGRDILLRLHRVGGHTHGATGRRGDNRHGRANGSTSSSTPTGERRLTRYRVPVGQAVKFNLTSADVIHGFYLPAFRIKQDAVPGRYTYVWLRAGEGG